MREITIISEEGTSIEGTSITEAFSGYNPNFIYKIGETVSVGNFDENRWNECAPGIHFFTTKQEAIDYRI